MTVTEPEPSYLLSLHRVPTNPVRPTMTVQTVKFVLRRHNNAAPPVQRMTIVRVKVCVRIRWASVCPVMTTVTAAVVIATPNCSDASNVSKTTIAVDKVYAVRTLSFVSNAKTTPIALPATVQPTAGHAFNANKTSIVMTKTRAPKICACLHKRVFIPWFHHRWTNAKPTSIVKDLQPIPVMNRSVCRENAAAAVVRRFDSTIVMKVVPAPKTAQQKPAFVRPPVFSPVVFTPN